MQPCKTGIGGCTSHKGTGLLNGQWSAHKEINFRRSNRWNGSELQLSDCTRQLELQPAASLCQPALLTRRPVHSLYRHQFLTWFPMSVHVLLATCSATAVLQLSPATCYSTVALQPHSNLLVQWLHCSFKSRRWRSQRHSECVPRMHQGAVSI